MFDGQKADAASGGELIYFEIIGNANDLANWKIKWRE
jgi:hypothetical protein